jgi:hypothetical protein
MVAHSAGQRCQDYEGRIKPTRWPLIFRSHRSFADFGFDMGVLFILRTSDSRNNAKD